MGVLHIAYPPVSSLLVPGLARIRAAATMIMVLIGIAAMTARQNLHGAVFGPIPVDRETCLYVARGQFTECLFGSAAANIFMQTPGDTRAGRLPVQLIDDLFQVTPNQRFQDFQHARVRPHRVEHIIFVAWTLHPAHDLAKALGLFDPDNLVLMTKSRRMSHPFRIPAIESLPDRCQFLRLEDAGDYQVPKLPV